MWYLLIIIFHALLALITCSVGCTVTDLIIYKEQFLHADWLRSKNMSINPKSMQKSEIEKKLSAKREIEKELSAKR